MFSVRELDPYRVVGVRLSQVVAILLLWNGRCEVVASCGNSVAFVVGCRWEEHGDMTAHKQLVEISREECSQVERLRAHTWRLLEKVIPSEDAQGCWARTSAGKSEV